MDACPICNGLSNVSKPCPFCGGEMEERGPLQEFIDDYSPYLSRELAANITGTRYCVHLYYCSACDQDVRVATPLWKI